MSSKSICIIGAGGHTRSLLNSIDKSKFNVLGIYDDSYSPLMSEEIMGIKVVGKVEEIPANIPRVISIWDMKRRKSALSKFGNSLLVDNIIHPSVIIETQSSLGVNNQILANVYINSCTVIGDGNLLNSGSIIEHEVQIGSHNHISVGAVLCGRVKIGSYCFIGAGSVVIDKITICDNVIIGANSTVIRNIIEPGVYVGNPAKKIK